MDARNAEREREREREREGGKVKAMLQVGHSKAEVQGIALCTFQISATSLSVDAAYPNPCRPILHRNCHACILKQKLTNTELRLSSCHESPCLLSRSAISCSCTAPICLQGRNLTLGLGMLLAAMATFVAFIFRGLWSLPMLGSVDHTLGQGRS